MNNTLEILRGIIDPALAEIGRYIDNAVNSASQATIASVSPTDATAANTLDVLTDIIDPALVEMASFGIPISPRARAMMYAVGMQESRLIHRFQLPQPNVANRKGPARGLWQFEAMGGTSGVLQHGATCNMAEQICRQHVGFHWNSPYAVWATLEYDDILAAKFARMLLWTDPGALPEPVIVNEQSAWDYYMRNWRPGSPHRGTWGRFWREAVGLTTT